MPSLQSEGPQCEASWSHAEAGEQTRAKEGPPEGARGGTGPQRSPRWSPCFLPGSASPTSPHGSPHTPQVPFKTDIRSQPFSRMQNPPVELHSTELNIRVSSVASPHLIPPRSPSLPDVKSYRPTPHALCPTCAGPWAVPEHPGPLHSLLLHGMPFPTPSWLIPSLHSGFCTNVTLSTRPHNLLCITLHIPHHFLFTISLTLIYVLLQTT